MATHTSGLEIPPLFLPTKDAYDWAHWGKKIAWFRTRDRAEYQASVPIDGWNQSWVRRAVSEEEVLVYLIEQEISR